MIYMYVCVYSFLTCLHCDLYQTPMASPCSSRSRAYSIYGVRVSITVAFIFFLSLLLQTPYSGGSMVEGSKMVIGSKPPTCENKCMKCSPCLATLVVPDHQRTKGFRVWSGEEDDGYYPLSWKCKCGDKLFPP